ncbi:MAG: hypothetical protein GF388_05675 [Candidatus Aegiribacteria sp.]|nr:hypothetical protein [Candidatus Aegiribacteria sp.]
MKRYIVKGKKIVDGGISELMCISVRTSESFWLNRDVVIQEIFKGTVFIVPNPDTELKICLSTKPDKTEYNNLEHVKNYS